VERANSIQVLAKAGALLDRLAAEPEVSAAGLADSVGEPRSTVYPLLASLQQIDMVEPGTRRGTYRLGLKLLRLGGAVSARFDQRQAAVPVMERIHQATGETVFLCIRASYEAVCIERIDGRWVQSMALRLGGSLPLHVGAAPRVLLASEPRELWEEYLARGPRAFYAAHAHDAEAPRPGAERDPAHGLLGERRRRRPRNGRRGRAHLRPSGLRVRRPLDERSPPHHPRTEPRGEPRADRLGCERNLGRARLRVGAGGRGRVGMPLVLGVDNALLASAPRARRPHGGGSARGDRLGRGPLPAGQPPPRPDARPGLAPTAREPGPGDRARAARVGRLPRPRP
jgi:DNA-binding IclR family transcriptional regulator